MLRWLGRLVVRNQSARLRLEIHRQDAIAQARYHGTRWRSGRQERRAADRFLRDLWPRIHPRTLADGPLIRIGRDGDGGYVIAQPHGTGTVVSIGVGEDNSADLWFAERGWQVVEWDPTISSPPALHPAITFHARGLGPASVDGRANLPDIIEASDVQGSAILMIDIEGEEYLPDIGMQARNLSVFDQIVIELHDLHRILDPEHRSRVEALVEELLEGHEVIHLHVNNSAPLHRVRGLPLPGVIEVTLAARRLAKSEPIGQDLPMHLDRPNDPRRRDHALPLTSIVGRARSSKL